MKFIKLSLALSIVTLLGFGCVRAKPIVTQQPIEKVAVLTGTMSALSEKELAEIKLNVTDGGGTATVPREFDSAWKIPSAVHPGQFGQAYQWYEGVNFVLVKQRNMWNPIENSVPAAYSYYGGPILFTGVMMSDDNGADWNALVSAPEYSLNGQPGRANPVGLYTKDRTLIVDFVDDHGAGSGEGNLSRYVSKDGLTWKRTACAYFTPETYIHTEADLYDPPKIKSTVCPKEIPLTLVASK